MNERTAGASAGWGQRQRQQQRQQQRSRQRLRWLRHFVPAVVAVVVLAVAHLAFGAAAPLATLVAAAALVAAAIAAVALAGPRHATVGMLVGLLVIAVAGLTGAAGSLDRAAPHLAALLAAGAMWTVGYVAARAGAVNVIWSALIWTSLAYCVWMFLAEIVATLTGGDVGIMAAAFETPAAASLLFGLFALLGSARVLHVVKRMDAEALARSDMIDRLLRDGLSGLLLVGFALTCLAMAKSQVGLLLAGAIMLAHAAWDTAPIASRPHRGFLLRVVHHLSPFAALALAAWGLSLAWLSDESVTAGVGVPEASTYLQRVEAYVQAWLQQPVFGYGLGSADAVGNGAMTLWNAKAMLAPGDAQNVFAHWLVEAGAVGLAILLLTLGAIHARVLAAMNAHEAPRTFARLAFAASALMLLHGVSDSSLDLPSAVWLYALLLGTASGIATIRRGEKRTSDEVVDVLQKGND